MCLSVKFSRYRAVNDQITFLACPGEDLNLNPLLKTGVFQIILQEHLFQKDVICTQKNAD